MAFCMMTFLNAVIQSTAITINNHILLVDRYIFRKYPPKGRANFNRFVKK